MALFVPVHRALAISVLLAACARRDPPPTTPGPPITADPEVSVGTMTDECNALVAALGAYKTCPNLEDNDVAHLDAWIARANRDFAASKKANPEANTQQAIAVACHRATESINAAAERCAAGKPPPRDEDE